MSQENNVIDMYHKLLEEEEWDELLTLIMMEVPSDRILLLWDILVECDLSKRQELVEKIYNYGAMLGKKDELGRHIFVRMTSALRKAN